MNIRAFTSGILALGLFPAVALAQQETRVTVERAAPNFAVQVGGGFNTFSTEYDKDTKVGPAWDVRGIAGTNMPIGLEAAYIGSSNQLKGTGSTDLYLLRNGGEALLRANLMPITQIDPKFLISSIDLMPYVAAGVGVSDQRTVDKDAKDFTTSTDLPGVTFEKARSTVNIPAAVGIDAAIAHNIDVGLRASYKYDFANRVVTNVAKADVQSWQGTARLGVAF